MTKLTSDTNNNKKLKKIQQKRNDTSEDSQLLGIQLAKEAKSLFEQLSTHVQNQDSNF